MPHVADAASEEVHVTPVIHLVAAGQTYTFSGKSELSLGRADTSDVAFASPYVSRVHGRLIYDGTGWIYEDVGSRRGTRHGEKPIRRLRLIGPTTLLLGEPGLGEEVHISPESPSQIFICYRREDAAGHAGRLRDGLAATFGDSQVFLDIDQLNIGEDFVERTLAVIRSCRVLLAVIGRHWLTCRDTGGGRRIDDPEDYVRREIAAALGRAPQIAVVPVLVHGARMPREADLPDEIQALSRRNAIALPDEMWRPELRRLLKRLEDLIQAGPPAGGGGAEPDPLDADRPN